MGERKHKGTNCSAVLGQMSHILGSWICVGTTASYLLPHYSRNNSHFSWWSIPLPTPPVSLYLPSPYLQLMLVQPDDLCFPSSSFQWNIAENSGSQRFIFNWFLVLLLVAMGTCFKTRSFLASVCHASISPPPHCFRSWSLTRFS